MRVGKASLTDSQVRDLLEAHQRNMFEISPPGTSFALDLSGLSGPTISLFGAWEGDTLMAVGALTDCRTPKPKSSPCVPMQTIWVKAQLKPF